MSGIRVRSSARSAPGLETNGWAAASNVVAAGRVALVPFDRTREQWSTFVASHPDAQLYHSPQWIEVLSRAYGFRTLVATVERAGRIAAGCLLSPSRIPFATRFIGLPFSDCAAVLSSDNEATDVLFDGLTRAARSGASLEIRGSAAPSPWRTVDCFREWSIDLRRPFSSIERGADRNFRRQVRRAAAQSISVEWGVGKVLLKRFYRLQLETRRRLGVPPQPMRFFELIHEVFTREQAMEIWIATREGQDLAGVVVLRCGDKLYAKWSARAAKGSDGASHLIFFSILERHAGDAALLDLGRTDTSNEGLTRFKGEMGATATILPYSYFPRLPRRVSTETLDGTAGAISRVWRHLPLPVTRAVGATAYGFLA